MHEYSIVQSLLDLCEDKAKEEGAKKVLSLDIKIGIMSSVEIELLQRAFDTFKDGTICKEAKLNIKRQNLILKCLECEKESIFEVPTFKCKYCDSLSVTVVDGEEMYLMSLTME